MKLLSIVMVVLNRRNEVEATLENIIAQKDEHVEFIVIDGASTDGTLDCIQRYSEHIDIMVSEPDGGIYNAMNKGIRLASGKFIGIIGAGDTFLPNVISRLLQEFSAAEEQIFHGCIKCYGSFLSYKKKSFSYVYGLNHELLKSEGMIAHPASFVSKSIYERYGLYDESYQIAADYECFLRFYTAGIQFKFLDLIICNFIRDGISSTQIALVSKENEQIRKKYGCGSVPNIFQRMLKFLVPYGLIVLRRKIMKHNRGPL